MADVGRAVRKAAVRVERRVDLLKYRLRERIGGRRPIMIMPYRGYGTPRRLRLKGRVLEDRGIRPASEDDTVLDNLVNMVKRFKSNEIPYARVLACFQEVCREVRADVEGYFEVEIAPARPLEPDRLWQRVELRLLEPLRPGYPPVHAVGEVLVPPPTARFGVISDIDDTIIHTSATNFLRMVHTVFLRNARARLPFEGAAAFYRALLRGGGGDNVNPLFYVSSSPWNLYDLLCEFFHIHGIPLGPLLFLRDWGLTEQEFLPTRHRTHKLREIRGIVGAFPHLPFILIGDSGQQDPEIYREVVDLYPGRIMAVYIRNVSRHPERIEAVRALAAEVLNAGSTLILADNTVPLARHALSMGWIAPDSMPDIVEQQRADEEPPTILETLLEDGDGEPPTMVIGAGRGARAAVEARRTAGDDEAGAQA